jgi:carbon storage regulator
VIVFPRKKDESIILDGDIVITVIEITGDKVRLGIELPKGATVHRREVFEALCRIEQREPIVTPSSEG